MIVFPQAIPKSVLIKQGVYREVAAAEAAVQTETT